MSEKLRKIKIVIGEGRNNAHIVDAETGEELSHVTSVNVRIDRSTGFKALATVEFFDVEVDIQANVEVETTKSYKYLEKGL
jgi:hypothetical protein